MADEESALPADAMSDNDRSWIPDAAIEGLKMERSLNPGETDIELTRKLFRESAPAAATAIVHVALYGQNEKIRVDAAKYVVERVLGRPGEENANGRSPLEELMEGVIKQEVPEGTTAAERHANGE